MLISVHVPKTAGTSLRKSLEIAFGKRMLLSYNTHPISDLMADRLARVSCKLNSIINGWKIVKCYDAIHGHFKAHTFDSLPGKKRYSIILRNPVDRVISHYIYWTKHKAHAANERNEIWDYMIKNKLDVNDFAELRQMVDFYSIFLGRKRIRDFDFVGLTEEYEVSLLLFEKIFGIRLEHERENVSERERYDELVKHLDLERLSRSQRRNRQIYDNGRHRFEQLCREYL